MNAVHDSGSTASNASFKEFTESANARYVPFPAFAEWASLNSASAIWEYHRTEFERARREYDADSLKQALDLVTRMAAVDTGAVEGLYEVDRGFTYSVAAQTATWQSLVSAKGDLVPYLIEAQLKAYELVLDAVTSKTPLSEAWIRRLHEVLCAPQTTYKVFTPVGWQERLLPKGSYKEYPNHVQLAGGTVHAYAPVGETTSAEMHRLVLELSREEFCLAHPILQAAYSHYALVAVHPFADGNGRVARALASVYLYKDASIPLLVFADQRSEYFEALHQADLGTRQSFVNFVQDCTIQAMSLVAEAIRSAALPTPEQSVEAIRKIFTGQKGLTHYQLDDMAYQFLTLAIEEVRRQISVLSLPDRMNIAVSVRKSHSAKTPPGFRECARGGPRQLLILFQTAQPIQAKIVQRFPLLVGTEQGPPDDFYLYSEESSDSFSVRATEIHPRVQDALKIRLELWVRRILAKGVNQLSKKAGSALRRSDFQGHGEPL